MTPQTVNAYYNPTDNTINFPAAILQPPFFDANGDDAINYGGIGAVIGHESSHGFDDQGSQFDGDGNNDNWWTKADRDEVRRAHRRSWSTSSTAMSRWRPPDKHVNGKLTLGENIADLGGLNVAYDALQAALKKNPDGGRRRRSTATPRTSASSSAWARVWRGDIAREGRSWCASTRIRTRRRSSARSALPRTCRRSRSAFPARPAIPWCAPATSG